MIVRRQAWRAVGAAALLAMATANCTVGSGSASSGPAPASSGSASGSSTAVAVPALTEAQAQEIFERYVRENAAADEKGDTEAIAHVEGGQLLEESRAEARLHQADGTKDTPVQYVRPTFLIPQQGAGQPAPQSFAVLSKTEGRESDRSSTLHYFTRGADGEWKAVLATWAVTEAATTTPSTPPNPTPSPESTVRVVRPEVLPPPARGASGGVELSPAAAADAGVCGRYAQYLSFAPPTGKRDSPDFEQGDFTSGLVDFFNGWDAKELVRNLSFRPVDNGLPVFRLQDGGSLVACTLDGTFHTQGRTPANWIAPGADTSALLGGTARKWADIQETWSVSAVVEVPPGGGPATVFATNAYQATKLSVKGVEWK